MAEILSVPLLVAGCGFFVAGTVGLLRFPDVYTRLHALTKIDNLGLGLIVLGLILRAPGVAQALKLVLVWLLALAASATVSYLVARRALTREVRPIEGRGETRSGEEDRAQGETP